MEGRPLSNSELWEQLLGRNCGRNTELRHRTGFSEESIKNILTMDYVQFSLIYDWFAQRADRKQKRLESFKKKKKIYDLIGFTACKPCLKCYSLLIVNGV